MKSQNKIVICGSGKFHYFEIADILIRYKRLDSFITNNKEIFRFTPEKRKYFRFDYLSFFLFVLNRFFLKFKIIKLNKVLHSNFPIIKFDFKDKVFYGFSLCSLKTIKSNEDFKKIIIDHGSPNLEYDKRVISNELKRNELNFRIYKNEIPENWAINQELQEFSKADLIIVASNFAKETFKNKKFFHKIKVLNLITNLNKIKEIKNYPKKFNITYVGDFSLRKGIHIMLEELVNYKGSKINFNLIGGDINSHSLSLEIKKYINLTKNINYKFHGKLEKKMLNKVYEKTHIFIMPSLADGYGIVINEALSYGIPVIISKYCGSCEVIKKYRAGSVYNPYKKRDLNNKLDKLMKKKNYMEKLKNISIFQKKIKKYKYDYEKKLLKYVEE